MSKKDRDIPAKASPTAGKKQDRRRKDKRGEPPSPKAVGKVAHDDLGNAVWNWRVDVPRRRDDDPTIDLLECLETDSLSLEDDDKTNPDEKFNPYNKRR